MVRVSGTRLRPGDVLRISDGSREWLSSYVGRHERLGDVIWVLREPVPPESSAGCSHFLGAGYYVFYPATTALRRGMIERAGFCPEGMRVVPRLLRYGTFPRNQDQPESWRITEHLGPGSPFVIREKLSPKEAQLPLAEIWNHEFLLERLRSGWHPLEDAGDPQP